MTGRGFRRARDARHGPAVSAAVSPRTVAMYAPAVVETTFAGGGKREGAPRWRGRLVLAHRPGGTAPVAYVLTGHPQDVLRQVEGPTFAIGVPDRSVSRSPHARVRFDPLLGVLHVQDLGRGPGTAVDGHRLGDAPVTARGGAVLRVGDALLAFSAWPEHPLLGDPDFPPTVGPARVLAERMVDRAALGEVHVLLLGPTGAGKERLAERYHTASGRPGPLVAVNCAGIPPDLFAAEVFGHERGAYSGAHQARPGLWRSAHQGTLFLDEVAELPVEQQSAVLRALDQGAIRPVGADADVRTDVRVIAATSRDVDRLEADGQIRPDLLARLGGLRVSVPALRERKEEVLPLFEAALGPGAPPLSTEAAERLLLHDWRKNVRELLNAAKVVKLFATEADVIGGNLLPETIGRSATGERNEGFRSFPPHESAPAFPKATEPPDREGLEALLGEHRGNVERIAQRLGVGRATVHRWLSKHGLDPAPYRKTKSSS